MGDLLTEEQKDELNERDERTLFAAAPGQPPEGMSPITYYR